MNRILRKRVVEAIASHYELTAVEADGARYVYSVDDIMPIQSTGEWECDDIHRLYLWTEKPPADFRKTKERI